MVCTYRENVVHTGLVSAVSGIHCVSWNTSPEGKWGLLYLSKIDIHVSNLMVF